MPSSLSELCKNMQNCTDKLEEEINNNINDCTKLLLSNQATETKLALEKAKDFHYKEILDFLTAIVANIRKIIVHEQKIRELSDEKNFTHDELKRYSYVQRQVNAFSNAEEAVTKRERRRVASEVSLDTLYSWEAYMEKKTEEEQKAIQEDKSNIPKRKRMNNRRRKKKFVSSTFNNFLDKSGERRLDSILEGGTTEDEPNLSDSLVEESETDSINESILESTAELSIDDVESVNDQDLDSCKKREQNSNCSSETEIYKHENHAETSDKYSVECISREHFLEDPIKVKPKIVDVVYKKKGN